MPGNGFCPQVENLVESRGIETITMLCFPLFLTNVYTRISDTILHKRVMGTHSSKSDSEPMWGIGALLSVGVLSDYIVLSVAAVELSVYCAISVLVGP